MRKQNWTAKSTNFEENARKIETVFVSRAYPGPRGFLLFFTGNFCHANRFLYIFLLARSAAARISPSRCKFPNKWKTTILKESLWDQRNQSKPCELNSLDVALDIAGVQKVSSEICSCNPAALEGIQFEVWMNEALETVEICVLCGWRFLNHFDIVSETPYSCDTVGCEL